MKKILIYTLLSIFFGCVTMATEDDIQTSKLQMKAKNVTDTELQTVSLNDDNLESLPTINYQEKTKSEIWKNEIHNVLYGEVEEISTTPLLKDSLNHEFKNGPLSEIKLWSAYRGSVQNIWNGADYRNTLYINNSLFSVVEGKFKNPKFRFCSIYLWTPGKPNHDFFNDVWGDQYIAYNFTKNDRIVAGYSRYDNGIEGNMAPHLLPLFNRSQIAYAYGNAQNLGVKVDGNHKYYKYSTGLFSSGRAFYDWFPGEEFVVNFGVKPLAKYDGKYGDLLLGATYNGGNADHGKVYNVGNAYADYGYKRLKLTFEYGVANGSNGSIGYSANKSEGFNATVAYRITPKIQTLFRYDTFNLNKEVSDNERTEYTVGVNYFLIGQALRLMMNYTTYNLKNSSYGSRIYAGTQILL